MKRTLALVMLAACGRIGFDPDADSGAAAADAFDDSQCTWSTPLPITDLSSPTADDAEPSLSPDGTTMVFVSDRQDSITRLFVSRRLGATWSTPTVISALNSDMGEGGPSWNGAGDRLYFASYRAGVLHLYQSDYSAAAFGPPSVPAGLAGLTEQTAPDVRGDELELFYSSRVPPSTIERAVRPTSAAPWQPLGALPELTGINDVGYPGLSADALTIYFEQTIGSRFTIARARRPTPTDAFAAISVVAELDGSSAFNNGDPEVSPDGTQLMFTSNRGGATYDLYVAQRVCP